ncbi:hypothetical protein OG756_40875 [Streptomyces sp. NBC_01310]|uniref:hypothetical protein n=1 Tax=Streptomyces sp. NBC_01310 TaxID=2903820 RepID=UPI0035B61720|nr:hypothetical protein OG756_00520 [Streptomyces sp. NBC_01310]WSJ63770.1 hypothetical protein OG756_40875 [Streptomyces sp. NBC_01310]
MARHLVRLQFIANGPAVEGEWTVLGPAEDRYTKWIGLYDTGLAVPAVVIQLITETDGRRHVLKTWTERGESEGGCAGGIGERL